MKQKGLIEKRDWDCLIILDACRYDCFKQLYNKYLEGDVQKVVSEGSCTIEWLKKSFQEKSYDDVVYVSANPVVNSKKRENLWAEFEGDEVFGKVIDVWDEYWNEEISSVWPNHVSKVSKRVRAKYPSKRIISHFIQPHYPYLHDSDGGFSPPTENEKNTKTNLRDREIVYGILKLILGRIFDPIFLYKLGRNLRIKSPKILEQIASNNGKKSLHRAYKNNLEIVLQEASNLVNSLPGQIVVTSDHGDFLGESQIFGHFPGSNHEILRKVPWLEIKTT